MKSKVMNHLTCCCVLIVFTLGAAESLCSQTLAFPLAEGYGKFSKGGRGGRVIEVTRLDDDLNPGTFRYAVAQTGPRTVVFRVSGTIILNSALTEFSVFLAAPTSLVGTLKTTNSIALSISYWLKVGALSGASMYTLQKGSFTRDTTVGASGKWYGFEIKTNAIRFSIDDDIVKSTVTVSNIDTRSTFLPPASVRVSICIG